MKKKRLAAYIAVSVFVSVFAVISGFSQEDVTTVHDSAFRRMMRPAVRFLHDDHNEKAEIEECSVCHHSYDAMGRKLEDESSEDMACSECHTLKNVDDPVPLIRVYHLQCKGCHLEKNAGPVMCGECHAN
ncbi:cytochrome c3 family protein [Desulfobacterales bacterium HSG2]|nr:cytochrome c3 family protein [Desulfobacterales bacterium HSG2]